MDEYPEIKILVATDIHLGYAEKDPVRKNDAMSTFEEVLQIAERKNVDMVLLGGDLFHENKPSRGIIYACMQLLRKYCFNDRPVALEFQTDPSVNFNHSAFPVVNYMDPNLNVGLPVFSIHGNHDDVSGNGLTAMDELHAAGLVNLFGKYNSLDSLDVWPIFLRKSDEAGNETKIGLYGFGAIRDERLHRMFMASKVTFRLPHEPALKDSYYNILVLHQNRVKHGSNNWIPEKFIPNFFNLVVWGHEHPCLIEPEEIASGVKIMQPGSTVATSLAEGEAGRKCVSLVTIKGKTMANEVIQLQTVRQFYFEHILLSETNIKPGRTDTARQVNDYCVSRVNHFIEQAKQEHTGNPRQPAEPLIRLRIDYSGGFEPFNVQRFGYHYASKVANWKDIVLFYCHRETKEKIKVDTTLMDRVVKHDGEELKWRVEDMVRQYFKDVDRSKKMVLLTEEAMSLALQRFVDKDEKDAIEMMVKIQLRKSQERIKQQMELSRTFDENSIKPFLEKVRDLRSETVQQDAQKDVEDLLKELDESRQQNPQAADGDGSALDETDLNDDRDDDVSEITEIEEKVPRRGAASTSGRGSRRGRGAARGRAASADASASTRGTRGRGRGGRQKGQTSIVDHVVEKRQSTSLKRSFLQSNDNGASAKASTSAKPHSRGKSPSLFGDADIDSFDFSD